MAPFQLPGPSRPLDPRERRQSAFLTRGVLALLTAAMAWVALAWIDRHAPLEAAEVPGACLVVGIGSALLTLAAAFLALGRKVAYPAVVLGAAAVCVPIAQRAGEVPDVAFLSLSWAAVMVCLACSRASVSTGLFSPKHPRLPAILSPAVLLLGSCALGLAAFAVGHRVPESTLGYRSLVGMLLVAAIVSTAFEWMLVAQRSMKRRTAVALTALTVLGAAVSWQSRLGLLILAVRMLVAVGWGAVAHESYGSVARYFWKRPALLVVLTFCGLGLVGGLILTFPACTTRPIPDLDALFTSVSAACVTGLTVLDTPGDFTFFGQLVILVLIQVGGLGIMTISAITMLLLRRALPSEEETALGEVVGTRTPSTTLRLVKVIAVATFAIEALGTILLFPAFVSKGLELDDAAWRAVFHSVSAFCNAGFSLQSTSLIDYRHDTYILGIISLLVLLGGIGFGVLVSLYDAVRQRRLRLSLHAKLAIRTSAILLVLGFVGFLALEWNATLAGESFGDRLLGAWFQTVTPRTAGFNSVDMSLLKPATILIFMVLMLVGASPISTGGGMKTTTAAVLLLSVRATVSRTGSPRIYGKQIPTEVVYRAAAVATLSVTAVILGAAILLATQGGSFEALLFESVSAFGTVGLSLGVTSGLDSMGKVVIISLMLVGRTGPLTLALLFRAGGPRRLRYPEENVLVG